MMAAAQFIPLKQWAESLFGENAPHVVTLRNWVHEGKISPRPMKVGKGYFCKPDARFIDPRTERIERMVNGR